MKQYKEGDMVVLDFSNCNPYSTFTPGGLRFPLSWRDRLQGVTVTIHKPYIIESRQRYYIKERFPELYEANIAIDEYCIRGYETENFFDTSGLEDLI